jgi:RNA polymerase sigma-70 factor (ECF subfamily)
VDQSFNDIALFNRIKNNDDRLALNTLFAQYYESLCSFAFSYLHSTEEAEESVADVFFQLWKNRHQLEIDKNLKSYLYVSVKHATFALIKKSKLTFEEIDDTIESTVSDDITPQTLLDYEELHEKVNVAINKLPHRCRQIFLMSRYEGLKYREIGAILSISEKTVENQLIKALAHVRSSLLANRDRTDYHISA